MPSLDGDIRKLTSLINNKFSQRVEFCKEFAQLRAMLKLQVGRAETLGSQLPATYSHRAAALPVAAPGFNVKLLQARKNPSAYLLPRDG